MAELAKLSNNRSKLKTRLTRFKTYFEQYRTDPNSKLSELRVRLRNIEPLLREFESVQDDIESKDNSDKQLQYRDEFESTYFQLVADAEEILAINANLNLSSAGPSHHNTPTPPPNGTNIQVKLPVINLPTFSGHYDQWISFAQMFDSLIDQNKDLSNVQKFHYLKSSLKGEATQVIDALPPSEASYAIAWKALKQRYQNKRVIVHTHIHTLFSLPTVVKDSATSIRALHNQLNLHLDMLRNLQLPVETWDSMIIYVVSTKFDFATTREWELTLTDELPTLIQLNKFLNDRGRVLESLEHAKGLQKNLSCHQSAKSSKTMSHAATANITCPMCKEAHFINQCPSFLNLSPPSRIETISKLKSCANCLRNNHNISQCRSTKTCKACNRRHNTLLHLNKSNTPNSADPQPSTSVAANRESDKSSCSSTSEVVCNLSHSSHQALLSTAIVHVYDASGKLHDCRLLLDVGSQSNFASESLLNKLGLKCKQVKIPIAGITQASSEANKIASIKFKSRYNNYNKTITCIIIPTITGNLPTYSFNPSCINIPNNIRCNLADNNFNVSAPVDLLLGAELFWELLCVGQVKLGKGQPHLQHTLLGWVIGGTFPVNNSQTVQSYLTTSNTKINNQIEKFWKIEETCHEPSLIKNADTKEETLCEMHFTETHKRDEKGRFIVQLPFKEIIKELGLSRDFALKRFKSLKRRLNKYPNLKQQYTKFMSDYLLLNHMEEVVDSGQPATDSNNHFYLPHHAVIKEKATTKLRVVFDGSAKSSTGISLNDTLMVGPTIQSDLFEILIRFRTHRIALTADIQKMYRQILVHPDHQGFQRIFWRDNVDQPIKIYKLKTVTYGTASAPFMAIRCLHQLAEEIKLTMPRLYSVITQDFYVDDLVTGFDNLADAAHLRDQLIDILHKGGFELHKWASNEPHLHLNNYDEGINNFIELHDFAETKTLGLIWHYKDDLFKYEIKPIAVPNKITKRVILSIIAQLFDPLGLIGPVITSAKILMQNLWNLKLDWDESVPLQIAAEFKLFVDKLNRVSEIKIPRKIINFNEESNRTFELHAFSDASESAYGACIYFKTISSNGVHSVHLICAKSRVAPIRSVSLPRLELCGALLAARLANKVKNILKIKIEKTFFWCDSTIVLSWLASPSKTWKTFVANRIAEIKNITEESSWNHVRSNQNPADFISRGATPSKLINASLWWTGPEWLAGPEEGWPVTKPVASDPIIIPERRQTVLVTTNLTANFDVINKFSSFERLQDTIAYCNRFIFNCRHKKEKLTGQLTADELNKAQNLIIKLIQAQEFADDIKRIKSKRPLNTQSRLLSLNPFLDDNNLLRVGGRLKGAPITYDAKCPLILPSKNHVTRLLIQREHENLLHAGAQTTLAAIRQKYWPIYGKNIVKKIIFQCIKCFRANPRSINYQMGNLPSQRAAPSRPFLNSGIDYAGPFSIRMSPGRGCKTIKCYVASFVCFATKALHIELVGDLTTESFLNALKRFISRRGFVANLYSDNATNFVGAQRELKNLQHLNEKCFPIELVKELSRFNIKWHFIPARSPHFGGIWEAGIKSIKTHLKKVIGETMLNYEEFYTLLTRIEAVLNSRPITPISTYPSDLVALTPGHFLIGEPLMSPVEPDLMEINVNRLSRWQISSTCVSTFGNAGSATI